MVYVSISTKRKSRKRIAKRAWKRRKYLQSTLVNSSQFYQNSNESDEGSNLAGENVFETVASNIKNDNLISNMSTTLRGKHLHAQAFNVYQWIKSQIEDQCTKEIKEKVSRATGVSVRTIERIIKEGSTSSEVDNDKRFKNPKKKRNHACTVRFSQYNL
ncbi:hypothetical protein FQA39_LY06674 [Lamprigera yunnana]|nr:hypothetical protein FQA39_LY06674 [Lamprigera yunnana]